VKLLYFNGDPGIDPFGTKGASTHIRETCRALIELGHEVLLLSARGEKVNALNPSNPDSGIPANDPLRQLRVHWVPAPTAKWLGFDGRRILLSHRMAAELAMLGLGDFKPEALYERYALYQDTALPYGNSAGWPRALEVNTLLAQEMSQRLKLKWLARRVERRIWRRAPLLVTLSHTLRRRILAELGHDGDDTESLRPIPVLSDELRKLDRNKPQFLISPMAVDSQRFAPERTAPDKTLRKLAQGRALVGYVGSLGGWHGSEQLLAIAESLRQMNAQALLVAVGDQPDRIARLAAKARERHLDHHLALHPAVPYERVPAIMAALDVAIIPETQEWSVPTKLFEYAAMQLPIVAAGREVVREFVEADPSAPWARCVPPNQPEAFAKSIMEALENTSATKSMVQNARRVVLTHHTWKANAQALIEALQAQNP
jgi:glycosyltransferase involved in cell wall biosynthesis